MKKLYVLGSCTLIISLYLYFFYRTEFTVVNTLIDSIFNVQNQEYLKDQYKIIQLPDWMIYSLPEGLWVFSAVLFPKKTYLQVNLEHQIVHLLNETIDTFQ